MVLYKKGMDEFINKTNNCRLSNANLGTSAIIEHGQINNANEEDKDETNYTDAYFGDRFVLFRLLDQLAIRYHGKNQNNLFGERRPVYSSG